MTDWTSLLQKMKNFDSFFKNLAKENYYSTRDWVFFYNKEERDDISFDSLCEIFSILLKISILPELNQNSLFES